MKTSLIIIVNALLLIAPPLGVANDVCPTDLDGDGHVDAVDLAVLLASWGECGASCPADIDGDGNVAASDLAMLLGDWGPCDCYAYLEVDGRVVFEAEAWTFRSEPINDHQWVSVPLESAGVAPRDVYRGDGYIQSLPDTNTSTGGLSGASVEYRIQIQTPGVYRLYPSWDGHNGNSDSYFVEIVELADGAGGLNADWWELVPPCGSSTLTDADFTTTPWFGSGVFEGSVACPPTAPVSWTISEPGIYHLRVTMREDGVAMDAFVLQLEALEAPSGTGPPVSPLVPCNE